MKRRTHARFAALSVVVLMLGAACHGVIQGGPGVPPPADGQLVDGLWAQTYTVDWKPVGSGGVAGSPTYQFELTSPPAQECNYIATATRRRLRMTAPATRPAWWTPLVAS